MSKYDIDSSEIQFQLGSDGRVLKNKLNITDLSEIDDVESELLLKLYEKIFIDSAIPSTLTFTDILTWHRQWLGNVYEWAGKIRSSNIGKGNFQFAAAGLLNGLISDFEVNILDRFHELAHLEREEFVQYLAVSHVEFILIHPVREGNGRLSRLLVDMMSQKAGYGLLDYSLWDENKEYYFRSIQAGMDREYQYIERLVRDVLPD